MRSPSGTITYKGEDLTEMAPEERAAKGMFLALQYPVEIPGVTTLNFLKTALNAQRRARGEKRSRRHDDAEDWCAPRPRRSTSPRTCSSAR